MRSVTEAGAHAPLQGGRFLVWWGGLVAIAFFVHWGIIEGLLGMGGSQLWMLWLAFVLVGSVGNFLIIRSLAGKHGLGSAANRASTAVWSSMGGSLLLFWVGISAGVLTGQIEAVFFNTMLPAGFLGYAIAWLTTGQMARSSIATYAGIASLLGMICCLIFITDPAVYLIAAGTAIASAFVPGLLLLQRERA